MGQSRPQLHCPAARTLARATGSSITLVRVTDANTIGDPEESQRAAPEGRGRDARRDG